MAPSFTSLTPLSFLERAADVFSDRTAIVHEDDRITYGEMGTAAVQLAGALRASGMEPQDRVAILCPNTPEMLISHFGIPLAGAVIVAINTRLASSEVQLICDHSGARLLLCHASLWPIVAPIADQLETVTEIVTIGEGEAVGATSYREFLVRGSDHEVSWSVEDELATIAINYTSGTTGTPKGVMYSHRGAYLNALGELIHSRFAVDSVYLWTLPMFHCNGWCTTWGVTAAGGRHICLSAIRPDQIWRLLADEEVTHLNGAPAVLSLIADASSAHRLTSKITVTTAGAPPSPTLIARFEELNAEIVHVYGLTETYGPYSICEAVPEWRELRVDARARLLARQGVGMVQADRLRVVGEDMLDVPRDGETIGEIVMRGNNVMNGYFRDDQATAEAFRGGWFHSGDLGVMHPDGYVELRDRAKDIIISGGENVASVEVEHAIVSHPAVAEAVVIGVPSERWGERPKAFVVLRPGAATRADEIIQHVQNTLARYKAPDSVEFVPELPRTSTGKVKKYELREREWISEAGRIRG